MEEKQTQGTGKQPNRLRVVKRPLDCLELYRADGGYIVKKRFKWQDVGPGTVAEPEPEPAIFTDVEQLNEYIMKELAQKP